MSEADERRGVAPAHGMRIACISMAALFVFGAVVQWNDPDPALWICAYLVGAAISGAAAEGRVWRWPTLAYVVVIALWAASLAPALPGAPSEAFTSIRMQAASHEEPREAIGLALLAAWSGVVAWRDARSGAPPRAG